nr:RecName: Full=52 kDa cell wall protein [Arabidopsis thaliana]
ATLTVFFRDN